MNEPVCGCNGKTYTNTCFAQVTDGVMMGSPGTCPITQSYTVCENNSEQIGPDTLPENTNFSWNPSVNLSCTDCYNPTVMPTGNTLYELEIYNTEDSTKTYFYYEVIVDNNCPVACIDTTLIDLNSDCALLFEPVCGCNGKTYSNECFAQIVGGTTSWIAGNCAVQSTDTICSGDSIQIGLASPPDDSVFSWNPSTGLSCIDCSSPDANPSASGTYELSVLSTIDQTTTFFYYDIIIESCIDLCESTDPIFTYEITDTIETGNPVANGANVYCFNAPENLDNICNYEWDFDNGTTSSVTNPCGISLPYLENGVAITEPYNVCLTLLDCDDSAVATCCMEVLSEAPVCICDNLNLPVCTTGGITYTNPCRANCNQVEILYNGNCCDIDNLPWLDSKIESACLDCIETIEFIEYDSNNFIAFFADNSDPTCQDNTQNMLFNCDGTIFCSSNCLILDTSYTTISTIWEKTSDCAPTSTCDSDTTYQFTWLHDYYKADSVSISAYTYEGNTVFYMEQCNNNPKMDFLVNCNNEFICGWGGPDGLTGENCPGFNEEAVFNKEVFPCRCIDIDLIDPDKTCGLIYVPVCGCNGITYTNFCFAKARGGVSSWTRGACPPPACTDSIVISENYLSSGHYNANYKLSISSSILESHSVKLNAEDEVQLDIGFSIPASTSLEIRNFPCY